MEKLTYEKPYIKKLHAGVMNKFGTRTGIQPVKQIDGVSVKSLIENYGSPVFVLSEKKSAKTTDQLTGHSVPATPKCSLPGAIKPII
ncbi:hypothetical protein [Mucilaginibacter sp. SP1R1]|uniref:hypothetical protein n=1 Tax=Mucilaginibacter sp. SP1R1 TaxID=2723091 RepID=UPI003B00259C